MTYEDTKTQWLSAMNAIADGDPSKVGGAQSWMNENLAKNQLWNIQIFCEILRDSTQRPSMHRLAASGIRMTLEYRSRRQLEQIRGAWTREVSAIVKETVMERLLVEDEVLRNQMISIAAMVFGIETPTKWSDFLGNLATALREAFSRQQPAVLNAWLTVLKELGYLPNFGELVQQSGGGFMPLMQTLVTLGTSPGDWSIDIRGISIMILYRYIEVRPSLLVPNPDEVHAALNGFVGCLELPMRLRNPKLFEACLQILLLIVKSFYQERNSFMEKVHELATLPWNDPDFREAPVVFREHALEFWRYVGMHEAKQLKRARYERPTENEDNLERLSSIVGAEIDNLFPIFVVELMTVKTKENSEEVDWGTSFVAVKPLQTFYCACQGRMGDKILTEVQKLSQQESLEAKIAATHLLWALGDPTEDAYVRKEVANLLIPGPTEFLLSACRQEEPHLQFTALLALELLLKLYKETYSRNLVAFLDRLTPIYEETKIDRTKPQILSQQLRVISELTGVYRICYVGKKEAGQRFALFVNFAKNVMVHSQRLGDDDASTLFRDAAYALSSWVMQSDDQNRGDVERLFSEVFQMLQRSSGPQMRDSQLAFVVQSQLCYVITEIIRRLGKHVLREHVHMIVEELFKLLRNRNALVYEEALYTLGQIIASTGVEIPDEILWQMLEIAKDSMGSKSPEVINSASLLIADTMKAHGQRLVDKFSVFWDLLVSVLHGMADIRYVHAMVIQALAAMLEGSNGDTSIFGDVSIQDNYDKAISSILSQVMQTSWNPESETDAEYMDGVLVALGSLHIQYCRLFHPLGGIFRPPLGRDEALKKEREVLLHGFVAYAEVAGKLPKPSESLFSIFCKVAEAYGNFTSRKNNVTLNRQPVHRFLKRFDNPKYKQAISKKAKETIKFLRNK